MEVDLREKLFNLSSKSDRAREYLKCKISPLYFIENYCSVPVAGGMVSIQESELWHSTPKFRQFVSALSILDAVEFMASRQHGKTTTALLYYLHALLFYPKFFYYLLTIFPILG